jgi:hypothetical protein
VAGLVAEQGVKLGPEQPLEPASPPPQQGPWWRRVAEYREAA